MKIYKNFIKNLLICFINNSLAFYKRYINNLMIYKILKNIVKFSILFYIIYLLIYFNINLNTFYSIIECESKIDLPNIIVTDESGKMQINSELLKKENQQSKETCTKCNKSMNILMFVVSIIIIIIKLKNGGNDTEIDSSDINSID